ncbi:MAG: hypothetical protein A3K19_24095 [Lentisphaerae bacterium RIFOXYB12_FULL_65_16]|nr:MAG: hypothetical protein A3K18_06855 [Lentisphaerae bacterium RIFOXYA12_64_32]OGV92005.1 MAG: hypothetical protein A3K19_24095 [Lentisphaerae bacterium RIFOXYB12_FULL_65_16]
MNTGRIAALILVVGGVAMAAEPLPPREALGKTDKYRILVDKVMSGANKWVFTADHMKETQAAGFNVISPRRGGDELKTCREQALLAQEYGLYYMAWMRGTLVAKGDVKMVWQDGTEQELCSPNSDEFWDWTTELVLGHAKISADVPAFIGPFLDYENYSPNKVDNCYDLSYDTKILKEFAVAKGIQMPDLPPAERHPWLVKNGQFEAFRSFQIDSWRARCRKLRQQVDAIDPKMQFTIYPAPGTPFMTEAVYPEWATPQAPLILADPWMYGRPSEFMEEGKALEANRTLLAKGMAVARLKGAPHFYCGGIDPVCPGADPEFSGKNASMISHLSDGYWIFYEGPKYTPEDHGVYFQWFQRANAEIAAGKFDLQHLPRAAAERLGKTTIERKTDKPQLGWYGMKDRMVETLGKDGTFEVHKVEGMSVEYLKQLNVVVLQNFNLELPADSEISRNLRAYVEQGGGLLLGHDTAWYMESMFPEVAQRDVPKNKAEAGRHVVDTNLAVSEPHASVGAVAKGQEFPTEFRDHMIFKPGPQGTVVIKNTFGDPVYVVAEIGKGRVVFSGCYYGYTNDLSGFEKTVFDAMIRWLARQ